MANLVKVEGLSEIQKHLKKMRKAALKNVQDALKKAGVRLLRASQELVPIQFGVLKASGFVRPLESGPLGIKPIIVGYTAAYAIYVHENLEAAHGADFNRKYAKEIASKRRKHTVKSGWFLRGEDEQAKFLESPLRSMKAELYEDIARLSKLKPEDLK